MRGKMIVSMAVLLMLLTGCGQVAGEVNQHANAAVKINYDSVEREIAERHESESVTFDWIEKGYSGIFAPTNDRLGETFEEITEREGEPIETGYYEGGVYLQFERVTFFINPETQRSVAIALQIEEEALTEKELKKALGTPDISEMNQMDGYWMFSYDLDDYELMFEAKSKDDVIEFVWLREVL
ncbi:DUF4309 domain-containing protein [Alkalihalobacillus hemicellulosilyticus]|uniref:DUF4309 domain-containing protein n=1 Tax=Halalkalibacter hemicellulosilyticusJCM 9152 TaxID=1236971 RepID=W4QCW6_9BACI|nr:DUF4309 domain-containing protein [Halalkalibacter hemicellulosilyticus]GAE29896.1 hypothetical protein JCM9152_1283 [Halalkalibacter hemicellulosilyticusJCM 9152]